jgi:hypothetical protein
MPVFRYALERFASDPYEFVVFHRGPLSTEHKQVVTATEKLAEDTNWPVNLTVRLVDLAATQTEKPARTPPADAPLPWLAVVPPRGADEMPLWSGPLRADDIRALVDSPARRAVAHRLMKGESAVFLLLESGRKEADEATAQLLQAELAKMEKSLELPPDNGMGQPRSALPLKISFSILRIGRGDAAERGLVKILSGSSQGAQDNAGPIVYPVFGRGHVLAALAGKALTSDTLQEVGEFLCGNCSCNLKGQLPGGDLLMAAAWETILQGDAISEDSAALTGLGPLARAAAAATAPPRAAAVSAPSPLVDAQHEATAGPPRHGILAASLLATLSVAIVLIAAGSMLLKRPRS